MSHRAQAIKTTIGCPEGQAPMLQRVNSYANNIQIIALSFLLAIIVLYFLYIRFFASSVTDTLFVRYKEFFSKAYGNITITFVIGLLAWSLVSEFVTDIVEPLVQASVPDYTNWYNNIVLKTYYQTGPNQQPETVNILMKPGPFLITFISFIISIILVFFVAEIIYKMSEVPLISIFSKYIAYIVVFGLVLFFLIWTVLDKDSVNQVEVCRPITSVTSVTSGPAQALRINQNQDINSLITTAATFANSIQTQTQTHPSMTPTTFLTQMPTREQKPQLTTAPYQ